MYRILLTDEQLEALKTVVNFADSQVNDGLGVFVTPAPCDIADTDEADIQYNKQFKLRNELNCILDNAKCLDK